jgi:hypothetical protein
MREIRQGQFYRHFKNKLYQVLAIAEHSETGEKMVVYQALYGDYKIYVRPYEMFASEVDHAKYPDVKQRYRFEQTEPGSDKKEKKSKAEPEDDQVNPILLEFLDADTLEEKMHVLAFYRNKVDENLLNSIAISLDLVVEKEGVQNQYDEIMNCLSMMKKFECNRFR